MKARELRKAHKLTLDELGRRTDIDRSRLSRFERNYGKLREEEITRLARALDVEPAELVEAAPSQA